VISQLTPIYLVDPRAAAAGVLLVLAGLATMVAPIDSAQTAMVAVTPGNWTAVNVPASASITGVSVEVDLLWSVPSSCNSLGCGGPNSHEPNPSYLIIVDCGTSPCTSSTNGSVVGETPPASWVSGASYSATAGHDYQVWAFRENNPWPKSANDPVPIRWTLVEPPLGGFLGISIVGIGVVALIHAVRRLWPLPKPEPRLY
jgi:hypothetical protein